MGEGDSPNGYIRLQGGGEGDQICQNLVYVHSLWTVSQRETLKYENVSYCKTIGSMIQLYNIIGEIWGRS